MDGSVRLFGIIDIPVVIIWVAIGVVALIIVGFVAWGFLKEIRKK